jgi:methionyl-tRNA formyltransferase
VAGAISINDSEDTRTQFKGFQKITRRLGLPLYIVKSEKEAENIIKKTRPDLVFVVCWYWLVSQEILKIVRDGFIGIHNSLLPGYRGGSPLVWAMINGEPEVGVSIFSLANGIDNGPIWGSARISVGENDYIGGILQKLENATIRLLRKKYSQIITGTLTPLPQDNGSATYYPQRHPDDGNISWDGPMKKIYNFIRAQAEPYPGAFTWWGEKKIKVWKALPDYSVCRGSPGQVAKISDTGVHVVCGDSKAVILQDIEMGGKRNSAKKLITSEEISFKCGI